MASSITSQVATALLAQGKAAVEAELSRIETDISGAVAKAQTEAATLAAVLSVKLDAHNAEANVTAALLARSAAITAPAQAGSGAPAITLSAKAGLVAKVKSFLTTHGWKGYAVLGLGVLVLHYLWTNKIL